MKFRNMTTVANEQQAMDTPKRRQPKIRGNGCPCVCCGGAPADIDVRKITNNGGKWIQLEDGRIVEYYVYGATTPDSKVFLMVTGSMCSAFGFTKNPPLVDLLQENNIKGISVNVPGHGGSSNHPSRRMWEYGEIDVAQVLKAEGVPGDAPLMIEGSSFGAAHAFSLLNAFSDRITHVHFHVPAFSWEVSKELGLKKVNEGLGKAYAPSYTQKCFLHPGHWCTPCFFCCCSMCFNCCGVAKCLVSDFKKHDEEIGWDVTGQTVKYTITHAHSQSTHGFINNMYLSQLYQEWGFHPFQDIPVKHIEKMKIMISYGKDDYSSPTGHGEYMAKYYSEKCNLNGELKTNASPQDVEGNDKGGKCVVNVKEGGHEAHYVTYHKGDLHKMLLSM